MVEKRGHFMEPTEEHLDEKKQNLRCFYKRILLMVFVLLLFIAAAITYIFTPKTIRVGFSPDQPIPFSHKIHAGELKLSCNTCHPYATYSKQAGIADTNSCLACHQQLQPESQSLSPLISPKKNKPKALPDSFYHQVHFAWRKVYSLPDYVAFPHHAHINRGVGCISCHGDVRAMEKIQVVSSMSMKWCLDCHRNPSPHLRPIEEIESPNFTLELYTKNNKHLSEIKTQEELGMFLQKQWKVFPKTDCTTCHY